jgi:copper chaperone NosL
MKKRMLITFLLLMIMAIAIAGCGKQDPKPVAINGTTDKCEVCNMAVQDNQYASEIILDNGKAIVFDDIGCMNEWLEENKGKKVDALFVRDYHTSEWLQMEKAYYVYDHSIKTPMAYNVISFETKNDAEEFINENKGTLLSYEDLQKHSWERNKEMMEQMKKMKMKMHDHKEDGEETEMEMDDSK